MKFNNHKLSALSERKLYILIFHSYVLLCYTFFSTLPNNLFPVSISDVALSFTSFISSTGRLPVNICARCLISSSIFSRSFLRLGSFSCWTKAELLEQNEEIESWQLELTRKKSLKYSCHSFNTDVISFTVSLRLTTRSFLTISTSSAA